MNSACPVVDAIWQTVACHHPDQLNSLYGDVMAAMPNLPTHDAASNRRALLGLDWLIRYAAPHALRHLGQEMHAVALELVSDIDTLEEQYSFHKQIYDAYEATYAIRHSEAAQGNGPEARAIRHAENVIHAAVEATSGQTPIWAAHIHIANAAGHMMAMHRKCADDADMEAMRSSLYEGHAQRLGHRNFGPAEDADVKDKLSVFMASHEYEGHQKASELLKKLIAVR